MTGTTARIRKPRLSKPQISIPQGTKRIALAVVAVLIVALFAGAAYQYWNNVRPAQQADTTRSEVGNVAAKGSVAILSYKHGSVDSDVAKAQKRLTGEFADYYKEFTGKVVIPAAKEKSVDTQASVVGTAVSTASGDRAVVLVFINQSTVTADNATPTLTASSVRVELAKVGGDWRIAKFDPV